MKRAILLYDIYKFPGLCINGYQTTATIAVNWPDCSTTKHAYLDSLYFPSMFVL